MAQQARFLLVVEDFAAEQLEHLYGVAGVFATLVVLEIEPAGLFVPERSFEHGLSSSARWASCGAGLPANSANWDANI